MVVGGRTSSRLKGGLLASPPPLLPTPYLTTPLLLTGTHCYGKLHLPDPVMSKAPARRRRTHLLCAARVAATVCNGVQRRATARNGARRGDSDGDGAQRSVLPVFRHFYRTSYASPSAVCDVELV
eukprot:gene19040-biopygen20498